MTRLLSLLLLVCFVFTQTAAAECSLVSDQPHAAGEKAVPHAPAAHAEHHHEGHGVSHRAAPAPPRDTPPHDRSPAHHTSGCAVVMACGVVALPAPAAEASHTLAAAEPAHPREGPAYLSPVLGTEPPPPRPAARN